ncbi:MAG TPA: VanZ family protein [Pyrinomonadaceae bacterium]|jgi:glycopeptide antibiotics resistance protein|nr:VanZ family protein [Pyrinomonadaceae bacterium]
MRSIRRELLTTTWVIYLLVVATLTIVPTHAFQLSLNSGQINLVPFGYSFKCFRWALDARSNLRGFCLLNLVGNVALFLPLGILVPAGDRTCSLKRLLLIALCLSLGIETIQFVMRFLGNARAVDIDDVILNTLGAFLGFAFYKALVAVGLFGKRSETDGSDLT